MLLCSREGDKSFVVRERGQHGFRGPLPILRLCSWRVLQDEGREDSPYFMRQGQRGGDEREDSHPKSKVKIAVLSLRTPRERDLFRSTLLLW